MSKKLSILVIGLFLGISCFINAQEDTHVVRVGYFKFDGYHMQTENGDKSGYGYEILQHLSGYAGIHFEYVGYDKSWEDMQDMLAKGEIDILTSAQKTKSREQLFDFTDWNIGVSQGILTTTLDNTKYLLEDYSNWNGIRVGMLKGNSRNKGFEKFAQDQGFTYVTVFYESTEEMLRDLQEHNKINAVLTSNLRKIRGEKILAKFESSPFYIMVKKGNTKLLKTLNNAIVQMDTLEPGMRTKLMNKYYSIEESSNISFSGEERNFIEQMKDKEIIAVINPDRKPYSYYKNGQLVGSMVEAANEIIKRSELNIKIKTTYDRDEYWNAISDSSTLIRFDAGTNYNLAEKYGYWLTSTYLEVPVARVFLKRKTEFKTIAVLSKSDIQKDYAEILKDLGYEVSEYNSVKEIVNAIITGKKDMAILPLPATTVIMHDDIRNKLSSEVLYGYSTTYAVAVKNTASPYLFSIMRKAVSSMSEEDMNRYSQSYEEDVEQEFSLIAYVYDNPVRILMILLAIFVVIFCLLALVYLVNKRKKAIEDVIKEQKINEVLQEAVKKAKAADEAKSSFMSRMSHEIRTPLNAIIGYTVLAKNEMAEAKSDSDRKQAEMKALDCLTKSDIASRHLLTIINDVLDMAAIESGKIQIVNDRFDFKGLITSLTTIFYSQAKAKGVSLEVLFDTLTEEWFVGDQMRTNQILTNLLSNAIKFTPDGGEVKLLIKQSIIDEKKANIHFEVSDSGIGMSKEYINHIWTPFEQADSSISRRFGGTGLGLTITKNLVDLMNGSIIVTSELGKGSKFAVDINYERTEQPGKKDSYDFGKINALVVDDDVSTCDYIKLLFTRFGARCLAVNSGKAAIEAFDKAKQSNEPYTVCLIDWRMPKMDGLETIKRIREIAGDSIPIIVITAYDYSEIADKAAEMGVNTFISKPLFQSSLFNLLSNLYGKPIIDKGIKDKKYHFNKERILLVEDNQMNMEIATKLLESVGLVVDSAWNGEEAVQKFEKSEQDEYKLILMDVQMPVMDGHSATRAIRALTHPMAKSIPIIAMTADAFAENVAEALESGMNDHISKPIDLPTLFETLKKYLTD